MSLSNEIWMNDCNVCVCVFVSLVERVNEGERVEWSGVESEKRVETQESIRYFEYTQHTTLSVCRFRLYVAVPVEKEGWQFWFSLNVGTCVLLVQHMIARNTYDSRTREFPAFLRRLYGGCLQYDSS